MVGQIITDPKTGKPPFDNNGNELAKSTYQPPAQVKDLFAKCMKDYQVAYGLQHRSFDEFDGISLLDRARLDQQTFAAYVGAEFVPAQKRWRWRGRKNTARNKLIGILAHMLSGMLYPFVHAHNDNNEEDKMTARVMRLLVEEHLHKAKYEIKFLFSVLSALVNPAVFVDVEYIEAIQTIKTRKSDGSVDIRKIVDTLLSGIHLNVRPVDEVMLGDFYSGTGNLTPLPFIIGVRRISYDTARGKWSGKYFMDGVDLFDYVQAGKTRVVLNSQEGQTLFDIDWTESDPNFVQELTFYYRSEDLQLTWVGGVGMFNYTDPYNTNPFAHRRLVPDKGEWVSMPVYPFAMSGFEPLDPAGRFAYYKSGAFKEYWDALGQDRMQQIAYDGTYLDVIKPLFMSGVAKIDETVMIPGATVAMPMNASVTPYQLGPNLAAALNMMKVQQDDMSESTQDKIMGGGAEKGVTAYATAKAEQNARVIYGLFAVTIADLVRQIGELTMDCIVNHVTVGELDTSVPEALRMKYRNFLTKTKDHGREVTNRIIFTDEFMGREMTQEQKEQMEWELYEQSGGEKSDQRLYKINPYKFARTIFNMSVDADKIIRKSTGLDRQEKLVAFNIMTDPRVAPFTDQRAVIDDFAIEEYGGDDPDRYKKKDFSQDEMLSSILGNSPTPPSVPANGVVSPPAI